MFEKGREKLKPLFVRYPRVKSSLVGFYNILYWKIDDCRVFLFEDLPIYSELLVNLLKYFFINPEREKGSRVLMLTTSQLDIDPRIRKECFSLSKAGISVDVLGYNSAPDGNEYIRNVVSEHVNYLLAKQDSRWRKLARFYQNEFITYVAANRDYGVVHANDMTTLTTAWCISRMLGIPLVYDAHEIWAENIIYKEGNYIPMNGMTRLFLRVYEGFMLRYTSLLISVSNSICREYTKRYKLSKEPFFLPNVPELALIKKNNDSSPSVRNLCNLDDAAFITAYIGGVNPLRNIEKVIEAHAFLPEECVFVIRGPGIEFYETQYMKLAEEYGVSGRIYALPAVKQIELLTAGKGVNCGIVMLRDMCRNFYWFYPNKFFEYMAMKLPVAVSNFPDVSFHIKEYKCGVTFNPESARSIADALLYLYEHPSEAADMGENGYKSIVDTYNWEAFEEKYVQEYCKLLGQEI